MAITDLLGSSAPWGQHGLDLDALLVPGAITPVFQPIVRLTDGAVVAYEALSRAAAGGPQLLRPDEWFRAAAAQGRVPELDAACLAAVATAGSPPAGRYLFVNISPTSLTHPEVLALRRRLPDRLVIEVTEQEAIADPGALRSELVRWTRERVRVALDDVGEGYAGLRQVVQLRPEFLKLDRSLIDGIDADPTRQALVAALVGYARQAGATMIAEGIETPGEHRWLTAAGVALGQGYLFARPGPGWPEVAAAEGGARIHGRTPAVLEAALEGAVTARQACEAAADHLFALGSLMPSVYLEAGGRLRCQAQRGLWQVLDGMKPTAGITGRTFRSGVTEYVPDVRDAPDYLEAIPGVVAEMCTPIVVGEVVAGALNVESLSDIDEPTRLAVEEVASALGRRLAALPVDVDVIPLRRLAALASALVAVGAPSQTAASVVRSLCELTGMDSGALALVGEQGERSIVAPCGPLQGALAATTPADLRRIDQLLEPLSSCYSSGEATGLTFVGGDALRGAGACAVIALPLVVQGHRRGLVLLASTVPIALGPEIIEPAELLATLAASCLENSRHVADLQARAHADALTGLGNHARFHDDLRDHEGELTVLMFDIDRFKQVNDTNGHLAGDEVLSETARSMARTAGADIRLYRVGGDEFAGLTAIVDPAAIDRRVAAVLDAGRMVLAPMGADLSWGAASRAVGEAPLEVMARADADLYDRKRAGAPPTRS